MLTPRDQTLLTIAAHHSVMRYDHVKELLGRHPGGQTKNPGVVEDTTVKDQISRWRRAGWIVYERVLASERGYLWVTKKGLQILGLEDLYDGKAPSAMRYHHYWAVLGVRLFWWDAEDEDPGEWIPERRLRAEITTTKRLGPDHAFAPIRMMPGPVPDAVVAGHGWCDAVEVQLSPLKPAEMQNKLENLCAATYRKTYTGEEYIYNHIHFYAATDAIAKSIERAKEHLTDKQKAKIEVDIDPSY
ncbi:MAG: hypothetical protein ACRDHW_01650, partial [Ktedonobacteraceae bacterium]